MSLPRFTSGNVGRLDFSTLNDAFGYIDVTRSTTSNPGAKFQGSEMIYARIGGSAPPSVDPEGRLHSWFEVELNSNNVWETLLEGRNSGPSNTGNPADFYRYPAIAFDYGNETSPEVGAIHVLYPKINRSGKLVYLAFPLPEPPTIFQITSNVSIGTGRWKYSGTKMRMSASGTYSMFEPEYTSSSIYNTLEVLSDDSSSNVFGVGSIRPQGVSVVRQPIRTFSYVVAHRHRGFGWHFSVPNGYQVVCT